MALDTSEIAKASGDAARRKLHKIMGLALRLLAAAEHRLEKRRSRRTLIDLTDDELRDVGLTRGQARTEVSKSWFWS